MPDIAKTKAVCLSLALLAIPAVGPSRASAQDAQSAPAPERCSGTLCDLYYRNSGSAPAVSSPAPPAGATVMTVPSMPSTGNFFSGLFGGHSSTPAQAGNTSGAAASSAQSSASSGFVHLDGGGLLGNDHDRCSGGTLCDLLGVSKPQPEQPTTEQALAQPDAATAPAEAAPRSTRRRHAVETTEDTKPRCHASSGDAWGCYR